MIKISLIFSFDSFPNKLLNNVKYSIILSFITKEYHIRDIIYKKLKQFNFSYFFTKKKRIQAKKKKKSMYVN